MSDNDQETVQIKLCPFSQQPCIQEKCAIWAEVSMMQPGITMPKKQGICAFIALCMISSTPKAQPMAAAPIKFPPGFPFGRG